MIPTIVASRVPSGDSTERLTKSGIVSLSSVSEVLTFKIDTVQSLLETTATGILYAVLDVSGPGDHKVMQFTISVPILITSATMGRRPRVLRVAEAPSTNIARRGISRSRGSRASGSASGVNSIFDMPSSKLTAVYSPLSPPQHSQSFDAVRHFSLNVNFATTSRSLVFVLRATTLVPLGKYTMFCSGELTSERSCQCLLRER